MKRIGIITHFYKTTNYGGNLQAYALAFFLNNRGYDAKQICYDYWSEHNIVDKSHCAKKRLNFVRFCKDCFFSLLNKTILRRRGLFIKRYKEERLAVFKEFQLRLVPHTDKEYFESNINELNSQFDYFITGSDQVFNFTWFRKAFWLDFASTNKISYAASMALDFIPCEKKEFVKNSLESFNSIGVRENKTIDLFKELVDKDIELNVDPTLLLDKNEWDNICSSRLVSEEYVFCYFLGDNEKSRKLAKRYAKLHHLKLVCIPVTIKWNKLIDEKYGDFSLPYASPSDFLSLIKYSSAVFTDSFHSCIFSIIYKKEFVVFNRDSKGTMNSRIFSLMNLFNTEKRFINKNSKCNIGEIESVLKEDASYESRDFKQFKESSISFLLNNLKGQ